MTDKLTQAAQAVIQAVDANHDTKEPPLKYTVPWREINALRAALLSLDQPSQGGEVASQDRESLGRIVRTVWIEWAREQPNPKPTWLQPWEELTEPEREVDRRIGERIASMALPAAPAQPLMSVHDMLSGAVTPAPDVTRRALIAAWRALRELSPCMADECKQVQTESLDGAIKLVDEALNAAPAQPVGQDEPALDGPYATTADMAKMFGASDNEAQAIQAKLDRITGGTLAVAASPAREEGPKGERLWLWRNFVDGRPEYWAFDNPYPCEPCGDPITLGEPCGYAIFKKSTRGRTDVSDEDVIAAIKRALHPAREPSPQREGTFSNLYHELLLAVGKKYPE